MLDFLAESDTTLMSCAEEQAPELQRARKTEETRKPLVLLFYIQRPLFDRSYSRMNPLGLMYLAAHIATKGYEPGVYSGAVKDVLALVERMQRTRTVAAIGLYCDYENMSVVSSFSRHAKQRWGMPIYVGGPQAFSLGREFLAESCCDAIVCGEGEQTLLELLDYHLHDTGRLEEILGITYLDEQRALRMNPPRPVFPNLDVLPIQLTQHSLNGQRRTFSVLSGRGCPFKCTFCFAGTVARSVRFRGVRQVMEEIRRGLEDNPEVKYIWFADDTFTLDRRRVAEFSKELTALRKQREFVWFCDAHPSTILKWPDMVPQMMDAGMVRMQIGIETGSPKVIALYNKQATLGEIERVVDLCIKAGLPQLCGNMIIGGAGETSETLQETWDYATKLITMAPGMIDITHTIFMPFPGTPITQWPTKFGMKIRDATALTSIGDYPVVETEQLSVEAITTAYMDFLIKISTLMQSLLDSGAVSHRDILRSYHFKTEFGIASMWYSLFERNRFLHRRYTLLSRSAAARMEDISPDALWRWRPLRVFTAWNTIALQDLIPSVTGYVLSPVEYELLLLCTGKSTLGSILERLREIFGERCEKLDETVLRILRDFEQRHWIVFTPY